MKTRISTDRKDHSWLATAGAGSALFFGVSTHAETFVQITLNTGSDNLNQVDTLAQDPQFNLDFTGDGIDDLVLTSTGYSVNATTSGFLFQSAVRAFVAGSTAVGGVPFQASARGRNSGFSTGLFGGRSTTYSNNVATVGLVEASSNFNTASFYEFVPIQITDARLRVGPVSGLLQITSIAFAGGLEATVRFDRLVFDLDDLDGGNLGSADLLSNYPEAQIIPEATSSLGLLALGAAGVLRRRRRKIGD